MAPYSDSVSLRLPYLVKLATERKSLTHYTKGTPSPVRWMFSRAAMILSSVLWSDEGRAGRFRHGRLAPVHEVPRGANTWPGVAECHANRRFNETSDAVRRPDSTIRQKKVY